MKPLLFSAILFFFNCSVKAQTTSQIEQLDFLAGYWIGDGFGGVSEEIWTPSSNGIITGLYRHFSDGKLNFSEFIQISSINDTLALRLKHFHPNLIGWEEKEDFVTFKLKSIEKNKAVFGGLTYELLDPNHLKIQLTMRKKDGSKFVETFNMVKKQL